MQLAPIVVRSFRASDAPRLVTIFCTAIDQLAADAYAPEARAAWRSRCPSAGDFCAVLSDGRHSFVAAGPDGQALGFSDLEANGHIQYLYVAPKAARHGLGLRLLSEVERCAHQHGIARIWSEASQIALPVFERAGFVRLARHDFLLSGVPIHNYTVEKRLA